MSLNKQGMLHKFVRVFIFENLFLDGIASYFFGNKANFNCRKGDVYLFLRLNHGRLWPIILAAKIGKSDQAILRVG